MLPGGYDVPHVCKHCKHCCPGRWLGFGEIISCGLGQNVPSDPSPGTCICADNESSDAMWEAVDWYRDREVSPDGGCPSWEKK